LARETNSPALVFYRQSHLAAQRQAWDEALALIEQALAVAPQQPEFHYQRARILTDSGDASSRVAARHALEQALRLRPTFFEAWNNLGLLLEEVDDPEAAERAFAQAVALRPSALSARKNLVRRLRLAARHEEILAVCDAGLREAPSEAALLQEKVAALIRLNRYAEAQSLLAVGGMAEDPWRNLWRHLAQRLATSNATAAARGIYQALMASRDSDWQARLGAALTLPVLPASVTALAGARADYRAGLATLLDLATAENLARASAEERFAAAERDNFFLAYHGQIDLDLQQQYGELLLRLLAVDSLAAHQGRSGLARDAWHPSPSRASPLLPGDSSPRRVGFVSAFVRDCTVGHYFRSWILGLASAGFAVTVFSFDRRDDVVTRELIAQGVSIVLLEGDFAARAQALAAAAQEVLIYPEIGMHGGTQALAALRLAPVQCAAWGHPISSGLPSIDVFFSSELMEPEGAQAHYAERLLCLPGLGTRYRAADDPPALARAALDLPAGPLLFYPHSLFKTHPEDDALLASVLSRQPMSRAILFSAESPEVTRDYKTRLEPSLLAAGVSPERLHFLPLMPRQRYLQVARSCQVMLDCLYWSGGNTTLDAFAVGLPVVTLPGKTMRSRQSAGMLRAMGIDELIAESPSELAENAVRLLKDVAWQTVKSKQIVERRVLLFDDPAPVQALVEAMEEFIALSGQKQRHAPV
jgi:CRISPR-associated protein Csy1